MAEKTYEVARFSARTKAFLGLLKTEDGELLLFPDKDCAEQWARWQTSKCQGRVVHVARLHSEG